MKAGETTAANPKFKLAHGRNMTSRRSIPTLVLTVNLFVADLLHAFTGFASWLANVFRRRRTQNQSGFSTERILPAGPLNQAIVGPFPRMIPFSSVFKSP
jgi:hypothetical protein